MTIMQDEEERPTETVELTSGIMQALLNLTSDPDAWTEKTKSMVRALHRGEVLGATGRWRVELTEQDVETVHYILQVWLLRHPKLRIRQTNIMCHQSKVYDRLNAEFEAKQRAAARKS